MAEEKKEPWLNQMALATVILAVCATLSTFKGGGYSTLSVISQTLASDQWAFFQAKSTKQHLYELQVEQFRLTAMSLPEIGEAFGGRDHTTVLHACRKIHELVEADQTLARDHALLVQILRG